MHARITERLRGTRPQDARVVHRPGWSDLPDFFEQLRARPLTPAAVLLPLIERDDGLHLLLTRRAKNLKHHAGQISFPGGRIETVDANPLAAALRETHEEVGLAAHQIEVAGYLDNYFTITGYSVTPVVGFVTGDVSLTIDPAEVADAFEVPLSHLFDPDNHQRKIKQIRGHDVPYFEIPWQERVIWGATAAMIVCFYRKVMDLP